MRTNPLTHARWRTRMEALAARWLIRKAAWRGGLLNAREGLGWCNTKMCSKSKRLRPART